MKHTEVPSHVFLKNTGSPRGRHTNSFWPDTWCSREHGSAGGRLERVPNSLHQSLASPNAAQIKGLELK